MTVSLVPEQVKPTRISLETQSEQNSGLTEERVEESIDRATYAVDTKMSEEEVRNNFWLGYENQMRQHVLVQAALEDRKQRLGLIQGISESAAADGRPLEVQERERILRLTQEEYQGNEKTIIERLYTKRLVEDILSSPEQPVLQEVYEDEPAVAEQMHSALETFVTKQQIAQTVLSEVRSRFDKQDPVAKGLNWAAGLIPFYTWSQQMNRIGKGGSFMLGQNIEAQMRSLYLQATPEDFESVLRDAVEEIAKGNLFEAMAFASAAVSYSGSDALWDNVFTGLDAVDVGTLGLSTGAYALKRAASVTKASARAGGNNRVARNVIAGNIQGASQVAAATRIRQAIAPVSNGPRVYTNLRQLLASGPGILDPKAYTRDAGSLANERAARLEEFLTTQRDLLVSTATDFTHVGRIGDPASVKAFALAEEHFKVAYPNLEDAIVDIRPIRESEEVYTGVDHIRILIGQKDATGFQKPSKAKFFAERIYRLPEGSFDIVDQDGNYFIQMTKNVDETDARVQDLRIVTDNQTPVTFTSGLFGLLRSNRSNVSKEAAKWRSLATFGGPGVLKRIAEVGQPIINLGKNEFGRLQSVLDLERNIVGAGGNPYRTVGDLEAAYQSRGLSLPSEAEVKAWASYRMIADYDYIVRNASLYRDKARLGVEQFSVGYSKGVDTGDGNKKHQFVNSDFFEARVVENLPTSQEAYTVAWIDAPSTRTAKDGVTTQEVASNGRWHFALSSRNRDYANLKAAIDSGEYKVLQVMDPKDRALREMVDSKGEPVEYLVVRNTKMKPLNPMQVPYSADLPYQVSSPFYVRQTKAHKTGSGRRVIDGDLTVMRAVSNAEGKQYAEAFEKGRQMVKEALASANPNLSHITRFVQENLPFANAKEFISRFRGNPYSADDAVFDIDTPFVLTERGQRSGDVKTYGSMWDDGLEVVNMDTSSHNLQNLLLDRGRLGGSGYGSEAHPVIDINAYPTLDPLAVISRAGERIARSRFYDDYIHRSVEDWTTEFAGALNVSPQELRANPMRYLLDPPYREDMTDRAYLAAAKDNRRAILQLLGQDTKESRTWKWFRQKAVDQVFKAHGQRTAQILEPWQFMDADPAQVGRSVMFHAKFGLFNVVQFPLQGLAVTHVMAIDGNPLRAVKAQFAFWGMRARGLAEVNPKAQGWITKRVSKALGVDEAVLDEMYDAWRQSGVGVVSGEFGPLDDYLNPKMFFGKGPLKSTLDTGAMFFTEGNRWHRGTAFATAFLRWREMNPNARLTNAAMKEILDRTELMYINMSRAGNAAWQGGETLWQKTGSIAATWFSYHARLSEQLLGMKNGLTGPEKVRLGLVYSAMWGVPIGVGGTTIGAFWPVGESVNQAMLENGVDTSDPLMRIFSEGLADYLVEFATGEDFNINERFGPNGLSWLRDLIEGDAYDVLGGAPGNFITDIVGSLDPFAKMLVTTFDGTPGAYQITDVDLINVVRNVTAANNLVKAQQVYNLGQYLSRDGRYIVHEESPGDLMLSIFQAAGLQPDDVTDAFAMVRSNQQFEETKRATEKSVQVQFEQGLRLLIQGEREQADAFFKNAYILMEMGGFDAVERGEVFKRTMKYNQSLVEDAAEQFVMNNPKAVEQYMKRLEDR